MTPTIGGVGPTGLYAARSPAIKHFDHKTANTDVSIHVGNSDNSLDTVDVFNHLPEKTDTIDPDVACVAPEKY